MENSKNKALWDDVNKRVADWEARHKVSPQPSKLGYLHILLSQVAPQFYSQKELSQIKNFHYLVKPAIARMKKKQNKKKPKNVTPKERVLIEEQFSDVVGENDIPLPAKNKYSRNEVNVSDKPTKLSAPELPILDDTIGNLFADLNIEAEKDDEISESDLVPKAEKEALHKREDAATRAFWQWNAPRDY